MGETSPLSIQQAEGATLYKNKRTQTMSTQPIAEWISITANTVTIIGISAIWWAYKARFHVTIEEELDISRHAINDWVKFHCTLRFNTERPIVGLRVYGIGDAIKLETVQDQTGQFPKAIEPTTGTLHIHGKLHSKRPKLQYLMIEYSLAGRPLRDQRAELLPIEFHDLVPGGLPLFRETKASRWLAPYRRRRNRKFRKNRIKAYPSQRTHAMRVKTSRRAVQISFENIDGKR